MSVPRDVRDDVVAHPSLGQVGRHVLLVHREVDDRFRRLLTEHDLPQPDRIIDEPRAVGFVWDDARRIVFVDFEEEEAAA